MSKARIIAITAIGCIAMGFSSCKLDESLHPDIFPSDEVENVPVNAVIEIQYPAKLEVTKAQMLKTLFSIHECEPQTLSSTEVESKAETATSTDASSTNKDKKEEGKKDETKKGETKKDEDENINAPKLLQEIKFFHRASVEKTTGNIFNYLVVDPDGRDSPLKPNTSYCVTARSLTNKAGATVEEHTTIFTTEDEGRFQFDTEISAEFHGKELAPTFTETIDGKTYTIKDYVLAYFPNQTVRPEQIKNKIKLCLKSEDRSTTSNACSDYGKLVSADVLLYNNLKTNEQKKLITSNYNLYAITSKIPLRPGDEYKVVLDLSANRSDEEGGLGTQETIFTVKADSTIMSWKHVLEEDIQDGDGNKMSTEIQQLFYLGSTS